MEKHLSSGPRMFILNNLINVIGNGKSRDYFEAIWQRISWPKGGLSDEQCKKSEDFDRYNLVSE